MRWDTVVLAGDGGVCAEFWRRRHRGLHVGIIHQQHHHRERKLDRLGPRSAPTKGQKTIYVLSV